ncbi:MAG: glutathione S-transferase N-terminal domain-containing protein [Proteobacteria bacterium]|nr:glutathione S-transferase N-terminal domain-containing protein [Pseudomonadota bacterium]
MTLYDYPRSGHAHRIRLFLSIIDEPYESVNVDMQKGEHKDPEYRKLSPLGQVPTLVDGDIVTRFRFAVAEGLKGVPTDTLEVVLPGGTLDGIRYRITGMPNFVPGEEVVLFLTRPDSAGRVWPVGLAQGGFRVRRETDSPPRVRRNFAGLRFQGSARAAGIQADDLRLDDLLDEVRSLTGATATGDRR